jgi:hypothetical protein
VQIQRSDMNVTDKYFNTLGTEYLLEYTYYYVSLERGSDAIQSTRHINMHKRGSARY